MQSDSLSLCLTHRRSHHPFMLWESFWLWLLALTPSHFALWLISCTGVTWFLRLCQQCLSSLLTSEGSSGHSLNHLLSGSLLFQWPGIWLQRLRRPMCMETRPSLWLCLFVLTTSSHKSCPSQDFSPSGSCLSSSVPPPDVFSRPLPQCPVNCILVPHCSRIWLSDCSIASAGTG